MPSRRSAPFTGRPSTSTSPTVGLPQPLGPTTATISSALQENDTSRSTSTGPRRPGNEKLILRNSSISEFSFEHDLFGPSFARRSGLREGGKPVSAFRDHALSF